MSEQHQLRRTAKRWLTKEQLAEVRHEAVKGGAGASCTIAVRSTVLVQLHDEYLEMWACLLRINRAFEKMLGQALVFEVKSALLALEGLAPREELAEQVIVDELRSRAELAERQQAKAERSADAAHETVRELREELDRGRGITRAQTTLGMRLTAQVRHMSRVLHWLDAERELGDEVHQRIRQVLDVDGPLYQREQG